MNGDKGQKLWSGLLLGYSAYKHISEAVVGEGGSVDFYSAALADVSVGLTVALGLKMGGLVAELPVYKKLAVAGV